MVKAISDWIIGNLVLFGTVMACLTFFISFIYDTCVTIDAKNKKNKKQTEKEILRKNGEYVTKMLSLADDLFSIADNRNRKVTYSKIVAFIFLAISYGFLLGGEMMNPEERLDILEKEIGQIQETTLEFAVRIQGLNENAQMSAQQTQQIQQQIEKIFQQQVLLVKMLCRAGLTAPGVEIIDSQPQVPRIVRFEINPEATRLDLTIIE